MRKNRIISCMLVALLLLSACNNIPKLDLENKTVSNEEEITTEAPLTDLPITSFEKPFGTYTIPESWFESKELSKDDMFFYLKEGTSIETPTSNISVSMGENKYGKDDFQTFARAIDQQTKMQIGSDITEYSGGGSYTENGYPLITMTVGEGDIRTIQHYIVGDFRHVLVHITDFNDAQIEDVEDAGLEIVNSFKWVDENKE